MFIIGYTANSINIDLFKKRLSKFSAQEEADLHSKDNFFYLSLKPSTKVIIRDLNKKTHFIAFKDGWVKGPSPTDPEAFIRKFYSPGSKEINRDLLKMRGSLCLSIVDFQTQDIFLARTFPSGHEIYYYYKNGLFLASNHVEPLVYMLGSELSIDRLTTVSALRFCSPSPTRTFFNEIRRIETGSSLLFRADNGIIVKKEFFVNPDNVSIKQKKITSLDSAETAWVNALKGSVNRDSISSRDKTAVTLSGGIDSPLVCALMREEGPHSINTISFIDSDADLSGKKETYDEHRLIDSIAKKLGLNHQFIDLMSIRGELERPIKEYAENCFDGIGSSVEYCILVRKIKDLGFTKVVTGFNADGLMKDLPGHKFLTNVLHKRLPDYYQFQLNQAILEQRWSRGILRRLNKNFMAHNCLYSYYHILESINENEFLIGLIEKDYLKTANEEFLCPPDEILKKFKNYTAIQHYVLSDIYKIGMNNFQRFNKAAKYCGIEWWSPYWDIDVMETALAISIDYRNKEYTKYLSRKLVADKIDSKIAYYGKRGLIRDVTKFFYDKWNIYEEIAHSDILDSLPLRDGVKYNIKKMILDKNKKLNKLFWPLYWMAKTAQKFKRIAAAA